MKIVDIIKKQKKTLIVTSSIVVGLLLIITFILPLIIRPIAEKEASKALHRKVSIDKIRINPLTISVQIDSLVIQEIKSKKTFVSFDRLYINIQIMSLIKRGLIVKTIQLDNPYISVCRNPDSSYNFSDLMESDTTKKKESSEFNYSLNNITINGGGITFEDMPENTNHEIKNLKLSVPFISNLDYYTDVFCTPFFYALVNGTPFELRGKTKPFDKTLETTIALKVDKINIAKYLEYIPQELKINLNSAFFSTDGQFTFMIKENKKPFLEYKGVVVIDSVNVTDKKDSLVLDLPSLNITIASAELASLQIDLKTVLVSRPVLKIDREKNGTVSLLNLLPHGKSEADTAKKNNGTNTREEAKLKLALNQFTLENARIVFTDKLPYKIFSDTIDSINVTINDFLLDKSFSYSLTMLNRRVERVVTNGIYTFNPISVRGTCSLNGIETKAYAVYFPKEMDIDLRNGTIDFKSDYSYSVNNDSAEISLMNGNFNLRDFTVFQKSTKEEVYSNKSITLVGINLNVSEQNVFVDSVILNSAKVTIKRLVDSSINLTSLVMGSKKDIVSDTLKVNKKNSEKPFIYDIRNVKITNYSVNFEDQTTADTNNIFLDKIYMSVNNLSNRKKQRTLLKFGANLNTDGHLAVNGNMTLEPLSGSLQIECKNVGLKPAEVYIADQLNVALTGGAISINGKVDFNQITPESLNVYYKGNAELNDFGTIARENADNFLLLKKLQLKNIDFTLNPVNVAIEEIGVTELYSLFTIYENGTTNFQSVIKQDSTKKNESVTQSTSIQDTQIVKSQNPEIRIDKVVLDNCNINFSDHRFRNIFYANMKNLNGAVTGLSSDQNVVADVSIDGKYDGVSPITISGKVNPLAKDLFVDIGLNFSDIDLTLMNPYSQKYLGYAIRKGKLSLDLQYQVKDKKLNSKNNIFMDQLTLGEPVKSPDATNLPIKLALALIRDQNGDIKLDVPITGSLDDPKFNIGKLLFQVLGNIITKAVTSPFAALGSLFGGSEELSFLEFEPGTFTVVNQSYEKLEKISKGLQKRGDLMVEIQGFADTVTDRAGLKKYLFEKKLKALKLKDLLRKSEKSLSIDSIIISPDEYEKYLQKVYAAEKISKPKNKLGFTKSMQVPEMEKLIVDNIEVKEEELKMLAGTRALKIKEYLINSKKIDPARIFLIEGKKVTPDLKEGVTSSRVEFMLKAD
jgi:hypothetical protein